MESLRDTPCARTTAGAARVIFGMAFGTALVVAGATPAVENQSAATADEGDAGVSPWALGTAALALVAWAGGALFFGRRVTRDLD